MLFMCMTKDILENAPLLQSLIAGLVPRLVDLVYIFINLHMIWLAHVTMICNNLLIFKQHGLQHLSKNLEVRERSRWKWTIVPDNVSIVHRNAKLVAKPCTFVLEGEPFT